MNQIRSHNTNGSPISMSGPSYAVYALPHTRPRPNTEGEPNIQQGCSYARHSFKLYQIDQFSGVGGETADGTGERRAGKIKSVGATSNHYSQHVTVEDG